VLKDLERYLRWIMGLGVTEILFKFCLSYLLAVWENYLNSVSLICQVGIIVFSGVVRIRGNLWTAS
jgi:hypothetical protein